MSDHDWIRIAQIEVERADAGKGPDDPLARAVVALVARCDALEKERDEWEQKARASAREAGGYLHDLLNTRTERDALEKERDEWKQESYLSKWPKEAAQEYHRLRVENPKLVRFVEDVREWAAVAASRPPDHPLLELLAEYDAGRQA